MTHKRVPTVPEVGNGADPRPDPVEITTVAQAIAQAHDVRQRLTRAVAKVDKQATYNSAIRHELIDLQSSNDAVLYFLERQLPIAKKE